MLFGKRRQGKKEASPEVDIVAEVNGLLMKAKYDHGNEVSNNHCLVRVASDATDENDRGTNPLHRVVVYVIPKGSHNVTSTARSQDLKLTISGKCSSDGLAFERMPWKNGGLVASFNEYKNTLVDPSFHLTLS